MSEQSRALPRQFYGDPVECVDEMRRVLKVGSDIEKRMAEQKRRHNGRRIRALVRKVIKNGGGR